MYALYIITFQYIIIWLDSPSFNCKLTWAIHLAVSYFDTQDHGTNSPHQLRNEGLIPALSTIMSIFWNSFTSMPCYPPKGGREASWKLGWKVSKLKFSKNTCSLYIYIYLYILLYYIHLVERGCSSTDSKASKNEEIWKDFEKIATRASLLMSPKQLDPNIETDQLVSVWGWWNPPSKLPDYSELMLLPIVYLATHLSISATSTSFCLTKNMQRSQIPYRNNHVYNSMQKWIAETNPRKDNEAFHLTLSHSLSVSYLSLSLSLSLGRVCDLLQVLQEHLLILHQTKNNSKNLEPNLSEAESFNKPILNVPSQGPLSWWLLRTKSYLSRHTWPPRPGFCRNSVKPWSINMDPVLLAKRIVARLWRSVSLQSVCFMLLILQQGFHIENFTVSLSSREAPKPTGWQWKVIISGGDVLLQKSRHWRKSMHPKIYLLWLG